MSSPPQRHSVNFKCYRGTQWTDGLIIYLADSAPEILFNVARITRRILELCGKPAIGRNRKPFIHSHTQRLIRFSGYRSVQFRSPSALENPNPCQAFSIVFNTCVRSWKCDWLLTIEPIIGVRTVRIPFLALQLEINRNSSP